MRYKGEPVLGIYHAGNALKGKSEVVRDKVSDTISVAQLEDLVEYRDAVIARFKELAHYIRFKLKVGETYTLNTGVKARVVAINWKTDRHGHYVDDMVTVVCRGRNSRRAVNLLNFISVLKTEKPLDLVNAVENRYMNRGN
jgi:hypothetical protein